MELNRTNVVIPFPLHTSKITEQKAQDCVVTIICKALNTLSI